MQVLLTCHNNVQIPYILSGDVTDLHVEQT